MSMCVYVCVCTCMHVRPCGFNAGGLTPTLPVDAMGNERKVGVRFYKLISERVEFHGKGAHLGSCG